MHKATDPHNTSKRHSPRRVQLAPSIRITISKSLQRETKTRPGGAGKRQFQEKEKKKTQRKNVKIGLQENGGTIKSEGFKEELQSSFYRNIYHIYIQMKGCSIFQKIM